MQMLENPWGIAVSGSATVKAEPDVVRIRFRIARTEREPAAAFVVTRAAVRTVRDALRAHDIGDAAVEASRLDLTTVTDYADGRSTVAGYQCQAAFSVESGALDDVEPLLVDLVAAGANEIESVGFDVADRSELRADARRRAVAAARAKAELYAEAAGVRIGAVVHLEDADPEQPGVPHARMMVAAADGGRDLAPGRIVVSAAVVVGYALS
jgi:uncharacterized protein YggE